MDENTLSHVDTRHHHLTELASRLAVGNRMGERERTGIVCLGHDQLIAKQVLKITKTPMYFAWFRIHCHAPGMQVLKTLRQCQQ